MNPTQPKPACLYIVATPLGNLKDITYRAVEVLKSVPVIACEDTRHTRKLLEHYGIKARLVSCHEHNEETAAGKVVSLVESGLPVALVSDAGTPGISDPGYRAVSLALERGITVMPVPGPSAVAAALSSSGLPTDSFYFAGFLPARTGAREKKLEELAALKASLVFYCPPHKLGRTLESMLRVLGNRRAAICREMTKVHEETLSSDIKGLLELVEKRKHPLKGEMVIVVEGASGQENRLVSEKELALQVEKFIQGLPESRSLGARELTRRCAEALGLPRNKIYPQVCAFLNKLEA